MTLLHDLFIEVACLEDMSYLELNDLQRHLSDQLSREHAFELLKIKGLEDCARGSEGTLNVEATRHQFLQKIGARMRGRRP